MPIAFHKLTWEDIKDLPEHHGRTEIVDGELVVSPIASPEHQRICQRLTLKLGPYVAAGHFGEFFGIPVHVILAEGVEYEPDQSFYRNDRLHRFEPSYFSGAPDLVVEVISESNRTHDTVVKFRDYERHGVAEYWLVDPRDSHIRVFRRSAAGKFQLVGIFAGGEKIVSPAFPDLRLDPAEIFSA